MQANFVKILQRSALSERKSIKTENNIFNTLFCYEKVKISLDTNDMFIYNRKIKSVIVSI